MYNRCRCPSPSRQKARHELVLNATRGLNPDSVGNVRLKPVRGKVASEGFAYGLAAATDKKKSLAALLHRQYEHVYWVDDFHQAARSVQEMLSQSKAAGLAQVLNLAKS